MEVHNLSLKPYFIAGLNVIEAAHDFVPKIKNWLLAQNIRNSFDKWHGKKCYKLKRIQEYH